MNEFWYFLAEITDIVGNQKTLYYATSNNCASELPGKTGKHENHIFHSNAVLYDSAASVGLCCTHNAPVRCLPERKIGICNVSDSV